MQLLLILLIIYIKKMSNTRKFFYIILSVIMVGSSFWIISYNIKITNQAIHEHVRNLVKSQLQVTEDQIRGSCIYREDKRFIIAVLESSDYFIVKDDVVKVFDWVNKETKQNIRFDY